MSNPEGGRNFLTIEQRASYATMLVTEHIHIDGLLSSSLHYLIDDNDVITIVFPADRISSQAIDDAKAFLKQYGFDDIQVDAK